MKKIKVFLKNNIKLFLGIIIGGIVFGTIGVYAAILYASSDVSYDNTTSGLTSTNVQDALDELYTKANTRIDPNIELNKIVTTNTTGRVYATSSGVCIVRKGKLSCFKTNNWSEEQNHIQQVFSDVSCRVDSSYVYCDASDFNCYVYSNGRVRCSDYSDNSYCYVRSDGSVSCT